MLRWASYFNQEIRGRKHQQDGNQAVGAGQSDMPPAVSAKAIGQEFHQDAIEICK
jgi:hypothetical protein